MQRRPAVRPAVANLVADSRVKITRKRLKIRLQCRERDFSQQPLKIHRGEEMVQEILIPIIQRVYAVKAETFRNRL
mgnify:CR=1 FL=1